MTPRRGNNFLFRSSKVLHGESVILKNTERDQSVSALVALCGHFFYLPLSPFFLTLSFYLNELTQ